MTLLHVSVAEGRDGHLSDLFSLCGTHTASVLAVCGLIQD